MTVHVCDIFQNRKDAEVPEDWWEKPYDYRIGWLDSTCGKDWAHASTHIAASGHTKSMVCDAIKNRPEMNIITKTTCHDQDV